MVSTKTKKIAAFIAIFLILLNTISALEISVTDLNSEKQGDNVYFDVQIDLSDKEAIQLNNENIFIRYGRLTITGPNDFNEICLIENGQITECNLDLSLDEINFQKENKITYQFKWDTPSEIEVGNYYVDFEVYLAETIDMPYSSCNVLTGRYEALYGFDHETLYDSELDLNNDNIVNLEDLIIFESAQEYNTNGELFGRFQGYFRLVEEYKTYNSILDLNGDGIINLSDLTLLSQELNSNELDLNGDGIEDLSDIVLLAQYFETGNLELDWNGDGIVDITDVILMAEDMQNNNISFDTNEDGIFDLSDIVIIAEIYSHPRISTEYETLLDLDGDEIVTLSDIVLLAQNIQNPINLIDSNSEIDLTEIVIGSLAANSASEGWCTIQLERIDHLFEIYNSEEQSFEITRRNSDNDENSNNDDYEDEQDYESTDETEGTFTPSSELDYLNGNLWPITFYLIAILISLGGIVILSKRF